MFAEIIAGFVFGYFEFLSDYNAKSRVGAISFLSSRDIGNKETNIAVGFFAEKGFIANMFSLRVDLPFGMGQSKFSFSDILATLKFNPLDIVLSPSFLLSFEFPTGSTPYTQDRIFISPKLSLKLDISVFKVSFLLGGNFSPEKSSEKYNILYPHTSNEVFLLVGGGLDIVPKILSGEIRLGGFYEEMKRVVFEPQAHLSISIPTQIFDIKGNIFGFLDVGQKGNVRQGYGAGAYLSVEF